MLNLAQFGRTLIIAPHPDDEVLGAGGTIARLSGMGIPIEIAIATTGRPPAYSQQAVIGVREEARAAHDRLGVSHTRWLDLPAAQLGEVAHGEINRAISEVVLELKPQTILAPFVGDIHMDHQRIFQSVLVAARPHQRHYPVTLLAYETLSETNWNAPYLVPSFVPQVFVDISEILETKISAFESFRSQIRQPPHERSTAALRALASLRGATVNRPAAEAFVLIRHVM